ncbi:MAG: hypothetical protein JRN23_00250 [Nitrososphaerota archaeon]|nr:hypothetical protein [Nitrososphaerota archaeon]
MIELVIVVVDVTVSVVVLEVLPDRSVSVAKNSNIASKVQIPTRMLSFLFFHIGQQPCFFSIARIIDASTFLLRRNASRPRGEELPPRIAQ